MEIDEVRARLKAAAEGLAAEAGRLRTEWAALGPEAPIRGRLPRRVQGERAQRLQAEIEGYLARWHAGESQEEPQGK